MVVVSTDVIIGVDIPFGVVILGGIVLVDVDGLLAKIVFIICELMIDLWITLYLIRVEWIHVRILPYLSYCMS